MHGVGLDDGGEGVDDLFGIVGVGLVAGADHVRYRVIVRTDRQNGPGFILFGIGPVRIEGGQQADQERGSQHQPVSAAQKPKGVEDKAGPVEPLFLCALFILHGLPPDRTRNAFRTFRTCRTFRIFHTCRTSHRRRSHSRSRNPPAAAARCAHR